MDINPDGVLVVRFTDGTQTMLGRIVGQDGRDGLDGQDGRDGASFDPEQLQALLQQAEFTVVFEGGDESTEANRSVVVKPFGGELRIPGQSLTIRNIDKNGRQVGSLFKDAAPLGQPLRLRFSPSLEASQ